MYTSQTHTTNVYRDYLTICLNKCIYIDIYVRHFYKYIYSPCLVSESNNCTENVNTICRVFLDILEDQIRTFTTIISLLRYISMRTRKLMERERLTWAH